MTRYAKPLTSAEIAEIRDEDIDFSDIPELDGSFWRVAALSMPRGTKRIKLRVERWRPDQFRAQDQD